MIMKKIVLSLIACVSILNTTYSMNKPTNNAKSTKILNLLFYTLITKTYATSSNQQTSYKNFLCNHQFSWLNPFNNYLCNNNDDLPPISNDPFLPNEFFLNLDSVFNVPKEYDNKQLDNDNEPILTANSTTENYTTPTELYSNYTESIFNTLQNRTFYFDLNPYCTEEDKDNNESIEPIDTTNNYNNFKQLIPAINNTVEYFTINPNIMEHDPITLADEYFESFHASIEPMLIELIKKTEKFKCPQEISEYVLKFYFSSLTKFMDNISNATNYDYSIAFMKRFYDLMLNDEALLNQINIQDLSFNTDC